MEENYIQKYNNDDKKPAKVFCLGSCILLDLIVLAGIIACFSTRNFLDLIIYAVVFVVAILIRIISLFFTYEVVVTFQNGNVRILKKYPTKQKRLFEGQVSQLKLKKFNAQDAKENGKYVRLCPKSCENGLYMVELLERKYLIYLDDYMFSLIEVKSDLS
ncbi:MAG: hypothetical protein K2I23_07335 [Clostridia bacterium]|nr:hypothetical protein [Clostridia bacterium]